MRLTAGVGQFVTVPDHMVEHYLARGWRHIDAPAAESVSDSGADAPKPPVKRGRRKVSNGVDATE